MSKWSGKKVLIIGAARQGTALARFLTKKDARVVLNDRRSMEELTEAQQALADLQVDWVTGSHPLDVLTGVDLVCLSGGVPLSLDLVQEALRRQIPLSNDSQIFFEEAPCAIIGITGSSGKTTTTALVGEIAQRHFAIRKPDQKVWIGGNIGNPLISIVDEIDAEDLAIVELSSFQLELMSRSPHIAAILNLKPDHLDRHETMSKYVSAKANILKHQTTGDIAILNRDDPLVRELYPEVKGRQITFGFNEPYQKEDSTFVKRDKLFLQASGQLAKIVKTDQVHLRGKHNLYNVLAAVAISAAARFSLGSIYEGITEFEGVPHRLSFVREWGGAAWFNDSIATSPERAIAALESFDEPIILLAGGRDKDLPWRPFINLITQKVDHLVVFGEAAGLILDGIAEISPEKRLLTIDRCTHLEEAVKKAAEHVETGDVVLLSPGGTSFDEFKDFEDRGRRFAQWVNNLS
jgi:UDP-N-acetylmuramoylalanine--D-glutamate ligase